MARRLKHPGPVSDERIVSKAGALEIVEIHLKKGMRLIDAVSQILEPAGIQGAGIRFKDLRLAPVSYVMPAYSPDDKHVAYYSETYTVSEEILIEDSNATYGIREGIPFMHFHGLWKDGEKQKGGHILASDSIVAEDGTAIAYSAKSVKIDSIYDKETNFTIFNPQKNRENDYKDTDRTCIIATVKANEDLVDAIALICKEHQISSGSIWTGIGSTVGGVFENGNTVEQIPTELITMNGQIVTDKDGELQVKYEAALIDVQGTIHFGGLRRGENPVLILFELVIAAD